MTQRIFQLVIIHRSLAHGCWLLIGETGDAAEGPASPPHVGLTCVREIELRLFTLVTLVGNMWMARTRGGHHARGGKRGGFSSRVSNRSTPSSMHMETSFGLESNVSQIPDALKILSPSHATIPALETDNTPVTQVPNEELQLDLCDSPCPSKQDKKRKGVLIKASGSVSGQLFSAGLMKKSKKTLGSSLPVEEPERSQTLLMNIVDQPHKPDRELDPHQRAVENLES